MTVVHFISVRMRGVIGQFCGSYFTVRPTKFESLTSEKTYQTSSVTYSTDLEFG